MTFRSKLKFRALKLLCERRIKEIAEKAAANERNIVLLGYRGFDFADGHDRQAGFVYAPYIPNFISRPIPEVKVYKGPGYPVDPELEAKRQSGRLFRIFRDPFSTV